MKLFLTMLFSSNLLFICYLILGRRNFSIGFKNFILKLALLFSIVPVAFLKVILEIIKNCISESNTPLESVISGKGDLFIVSQKGFNMTVPLKIKIFIVGIWFIIGITIFLYRIHRYFLQKKKIIKFMTQDTNKETHELLDKYKKELNIHRQIRLFVSDVRASPFTTGIWTPIVVIPSDFTLPEVGLIIKHELNHIKQGDNIYGFLRLFTLSLYWFNPLAYLMDYHLEKNSELNCDVKVVSYYDKEKRSSYSKLIVKIASLKSYNEAYLYNFSKQSNDIKERVLNIMYKKKLTKKEWIISVLLTICMIFVSGVPVFAYEVPNVLGIEKNKIAYNIGIDNTIGFHTDDAEGYQFENILYDKQFIDSYGNIYNAEDIYGQSRFWCDQHSYVNGTFTDHLKKNNGGCKMEYYEAQRCSVCGYIVVGDLQKTVEYVVCPH